MSLAAPLPTRVIKLGGSLLEDPHLRSRFAIWLARQIPANNVVVVGGGGLVDALRAIDRAQQLATTHSHALAIDAMSVTARLAATLLELPCIDRRSGLADLAGATAILDVRLFILEEEPELEGEPIPSSWQVTSDSIAARLADALRATELVLLKSTLPPPGATLEEASDAEYVDAYFPHAAARVPQVRCVDLRSDELREQSIGAV